MSDRSGRDSGTVMSTSSPGSKDAKSGFGSGKAVPSNRIGSMVAAAADMGPHKQTVSKVARRTALRDVSLARWARLRIIRLFHIFNLSDLPGDPAAEWATYFKK
jgi:hypothetical protein